LAVDFIRCGDRLSDGRTEQLAVALSQAMHGDFDGPHGQAQLLRKRFERRAVLTGEENLQRVEPGLFAFCGEFPLQLVERSFEQRQCPAAQEDALGGPGMRRLALIAPFAVVEVERQRPSPTTALLCRSALLLRGEESSECRN
jgi:hypothetical protein